MQGAAVCRRRVRGFLPLALLLLAAGRVGPVDALAREYASDEQIGIEPKVGDTVPLDLEFRDEDGLPVRLGDLIERPTVLTLIYLKCPSICYPLVNELARAVDLIDDLTPGEDYDLISVSFDVDDTPQEAKEGKESFLNRMDRKVRPEAWHFLTGDEDEVTALTDAVGFRFRQEEEGFVHAGTVIFLTSEGRIVRYLEPTYPDATGLPKLLAFDVRMALFDAAKGRTRNLMQRIQRLCYAWDPESKTYVFQVNRIVLGVTLAGVGAFLLFLLLRRRRPDASAPPGPAPTPGEPVS